MTFLANLIKFVNYLKITFDLISYLEACLPILKTKLATLNFKALQDLVGSVDYYFHLDQPFLEDSALAKETFT